MQDPVFQRKIQKSGHARATGQRRPDDSTNIIVAGESGAGKSLLVNKLFDNDQLCQVNHVGANGKSELISYKQKDKQRDVNIFDFTGSLNELTNDSMLYSNKTLRSCIGPHRSSSSIYPNLILFVWKASDDRLNGIKFRNSLEELRKIRVVDPKQPNIIFVLTHSLCLGTNEKIFADSLKKRICEINLSVSQVLKLTNVSIVPVENLPEIFSLQPNGDFFKLPNGDLSHHNLMMAMFEVFKNNGDYNALNDTGTLCYPGNVQTQSLRRRACNDSLLEWIHYADKDSRPHTANKFTTSSKNIIDTPISSFDCEVNNETEVQNFQTTNRKILSSYSNNRNFSTTTTTQNCHSFSKGGDRSLLISIDENNEATLSPRQIRKREEYRQINMLFLFIFFSILASIILVLALFGSTGILSKTGYIPNQTLVHLSAQSCKNYSNPLRSTTVHPEADSLDQMKDNNLTSTSISNFKVDNLDQYMSLTKNIYEKEQVFVTLGANTNLKCDKGMEYKNTQHVKGLTINGTMVEKTVACVLGQFRFIENLTIIAEKECSIDKNNQKTEKLLLKYLKSLAVDVENEFQGVLELLHNAFEFPLVNELSLRNGKVSEGTCYHVQHILSSTKLTSLAFIKVTWSSQCLLRKQNEIAYETLKLLRLDMLSTVQLDAWYLKEIFDSFPNLETFQINFGYAKDSQLFNINGISRLKNLRLNIRVSNNIFNAEVLLERFPCLETLYLQLVFETENSSTSYSIIGYDTLNELLDSFTVFANRRYTHINGALTHKIMDQIQQHCNSSSPH